MPWSPSCRALKDDAADHHRQRRGEPALPAPAAVEEIPARARPTSAGCISARKPGTPNTMSTSGCRPTVTAIDRERQTVTLGDGLELAYADIALATGAPPRAACRRRSAATLDGRLSPSATIIDADRLGLEEMKPGRRALIVGGGYIGLEARGRRPRPRA